MKTLYERYKIGKLPKPKNLLETLTRIRQILRKKENWVKGNLYNYDDSYIEIVDRLQDGSFSGFL